MNPFIRHIVIGNPANRRVQFFQQALSRIGLEPATVVSYIDLLKKKGSLEKAIELLSAVSKGKSRVLLRIESPGEDFDVERCMIARGAGLVNSKTRPAEISRHAALRLRHDHGKIAYPAQWLAGFTSLLAEVSAAMSRFPMVKLYSNAEDILVMFHKPTCYKRLELANVSLPKALFDVESFDDLRERMRVLQWKRVFVKLASGSSASGVIALTMHGATMRAVTSMELVRSGSRSQFYNNLKLRVYHREKEISQAIQFLFRESAHVEQWLPKAHQLGRNFDLRIVSIDGRPSHIVVRTSHSPLTNLHLGNRRGDVDLLRKDMGQTRWQCMLDVAERAARAFPNTVCVGLDVLLQPGFRSPTILEANAFGDLLPGITSQGQNTYEAQIAAMIFHGNKGA